jgi:hypothetical protein
MPIEFRCPVCGQNLRVADHHAGQQAKCPQCGNLASVPAGAADPLGPASGISSFASDFAAATSPSNFGEIGTADQWRLKTRTGDTFGPVSRVELDRWLADGRIDAGTQIQQEGWTRWRPAAEIYPSLATRSTAGAFQDVGGQYSYVKPHRGSVILALGICSVVMCGVFGIPAWIMGHADLREIREGRMDKTGEGTTQAGYVCGIIGTVLFLIQMVFILLYIIFIVGVIAAAAAGAK